METEGDIGMCVCVSDGESAHGLVVLVLGSAGKAIGGSYKPR
ncbi:hypothetical protein ES703_110332 [subsurface metagenome]